MRGEKCTVSFLAHITLATAIAAECQLPAVHVYAGGRALGKGLGAEPPLPKGLVCARVLLPQDQEPAASASGSNPSIPSPVSAFLDPDLLVLTTKLLLVFMTVNVGTLYCN